MDAKDLTIDDLAYMVVGGDSPGDAIMYGEHFGMDDIQEVFEDKREELDVSTVGNCAPSSDRKLKISYDEKARM